MTKLREQMTHEMVLRGLAPNTLRTTTRYIHLMEPARGAARICPDLLDFDPE